MNPFTKLCVVLLVLIQNISCAKRASFELQDIHLTAKEGSCIEINCNIGTHVYSTDAYWFWMKDAKWNEKSKDFDATIIYSTNNTARPVNPDFAGRVKYTGSLNWDYYSSSEKCSIIICKLNKTDSGSYSVRYVRDVGDVKEHTVWKTTTDVNLKVTENPCLITFKEPPLLQENDTATLTCSTLRSCPSDPQITSFAQLDLSTHSDLQGDAGQKSTTVSFRASWEDDGREFSCQTQADTDPYLIQNISLTVEYAPRDILAKISPGNIIEGQPVNLTCSAKGRPVPKFTWFKKEKMFSEPEWIIPSITDSQSGEYYCEAQNKHGTKKSNTLVVNVTYVPELEVKMTSPTTNVRQGDKITLTCDVKRSKPQPDTYSWSKDGQRLKWQEFKFSIEHIKPEDSGLYTCSATNTAGTGTSASYEIRVQYRPRNTTISTKGHSTAKVRLKVKVGGTLTFNCSAEAHPKPRRYSWYRYNPNKQVEFSQWGPENDFENNVTLTSIQRADEACYVCNATNDIGTGEDSDPLCLEVLYPPTRPVLSMDTEVTEGQSITITCSVESNPKSDLSLKHSFTSNTWSSELLNAKYEHTNKLEHTFNVTSTHTGFYICDAENSEGSKRSEQRKLVVKYRPKDVTVEAQPGLVVNENTRLTLSCKAQSHPPVTSVTWMKMINGKSQNIHLKESLSVRPSDSGQYSCSATNEIGTGKSPQVEVKVKYAPKITNIARAAEQQHPDGRHFVTLSCSSHSYPPVSKYTWYMKAKEEERGKKVSDKQNHTVYSDQPGFYYCSAKNEINEKISDPVQLFADRHFMKLLLLALIILPVIFLLIFVYRHKRKKSHQRGTTNTTSRFGFLGWQNKSRRRNLMNEPVMAEPFRSRDDLLPDQRCRPNAQRSQPPPDSTPASSIDTVYSIVNLPAGKQGPSAQKPIRRQGGHTDNESLNYASLHFENKQKKKQPKAEDSAVYAMVSKQKSPKEKAQEILADYENMSAAHGAKSPNPMNYDTDTSEDEVDINYSQVSFKAKPGHQRACRDSSSDTSSDSSTSDEEEETQYSQVKV